MKRLLSICHFAKLAATIAALHFAAANDLYALETLKVPYTADIGTFDPDDGFEIGAMSALNNVYEGLVQYEPGTVRVVGRLAKTWSISADALSYRFHLVEGVKFHDGSTMTADDVVASLTRRRDGNLALSYFLLNVDEIRAEGSSTVYIRLKRPQPSFIDALASPWGPKVISQRAMREHNRGDNATAWLSEHADGTGPYKLTTFERGYRYKLSRNESYWGSRPFFDEIGLPVVPEISQQILQLRSGQVDVLPTGYPFSQLRSLPAGVEVTAVDSTILYTLFPRSGSALDDPKVRAAFLAVINPQLWVKEAFGEYGSVARSIYPRVVLDPLEPIAFPTDLEAAKAAVSGRGISISIGLHGSTPTYRKIADLLIVQLATVGIDATAYMLPPGAAFGLKNAKQVPDLLLTIAGPDAAHPENQAKAFFTSDAPLNFFGRSDARADLLFDEAGAIVDESKRNTLYEEAGRIIFTSGIAIPLVEVQDVVVHEAGLRDLGLRPVYPPGNIDFGTARR